MTSERHFKARKTQFFDFGEDARIPYTFYKDRYYPTLPVAKLAPIPFVSRFPMTFLATYADSTGAPAFSSAHPGPQPVKYVAYFLLDEILHCAIILFFLRNFL